MRKITWRLARWVHAGTLAFLSSPSGRSDTTEPMTPRTQTMRRFIPLIGLLSLFGVNCSQPTTTQLIVLMDTDYSVLDDSRIVNPEAPEDDYFGCKVATIGDLDNDGVTDIAVGAYMDDDGDGEPVDRGAVWIIFLK